MALQKAGIDPVIYEAHPAGADGIGAFLTLASNGIDALRTLGADQPALAAGFPTPAITCAAARQAPRPDPHRRVARRRHDQLHHQARRPVPVLHQRPRPGRRVEHGKRLVAAEQAGDGVRAVFADGSEAAGDVLIGCDGVHSAVRPIIDPPRRPRRTPGCSTPAATSAACRSTPSPEATR